MFSVSVTCYILYTNIIIVIFIIITMNYIFSSRVHRIVMLAGGKMFLVNAAAGAECSFCK